MVRLCFKGNILTVSFSVLRFPISHILHKKNIPLFLTSPRTIFVLNSPRPYMATIIDKLL